MSVERILTVEEVAKTLCVSKSLVYDLITRGELRSVKITPGKGPVRVTPSDLRAFLEERSGGHSSRKDVDYV